MAISRLFTEIGKDVDRLDASLRKSMESAREAGVHITASGQRMLAAFDRALNPSKELAEQIRLLEKTGKSGSDIWKVYGDRMQTVSDVTRKNGQAVDPLISKHLSLNKATEGSKFNFESLGRSVQDFATNPMAAAQNGITSVMSSMGPLAVGMASAAVGIGLATKALFDMGVQAADEAEKLENLSISTGLRTQELQAMAQIAKEAGLEGMDLGRQIGKLNEQLGSPEGGDFTKALVANDIALQNSNGKTKTAVQLLDELRLKFIGIVDPIDRAQAMQAALGGRLRDLIPLLMSSNESLAEQIEVMKKTGPVWDDITQKKLLAFEHNVEMIGRTWSAVVTDIKAGVGSILGDLSRLPQNGIDPSKLSDEEAVKFYQSSQIGGANGVKFLPSPFDNIKVDAESFKGAEKLSREVFNAQQKLIAQGVDHIDLVMKLSAENVMLDNLINKGTREQVIGKALIVRGLNEQLKAVRALKQEQEPQLTAAQQISNQQFIEMMAASEDKRRKEESKFNLDIPKRPEGDLGWSPSGLGDSIKDFTAIMEKENARIAEMMERSRDFTKTGQEEQLDVLRQYYAEIQELRDLDLVSERESSNAKKRIAAVETAVKLQQADTFFATLESMQGSHIRAISVIAKAAAIAQATINTYVGATKALADGGTWGALQMGAVLAAGFAQVAAIAAQGFEHGGLVTGGDQLIRVNETGRPEFVVNADATKDYLPFLKAINSGQNIGADMDSGRGFGNIARTALNVTIANYGSSKQFEVEQIDESTVRVIARDEALGVLSRKGPEVIANDIAYPNSKTSKALARHTTARRGDR